jgi:hypothetical protein
VPIPAIVTAGEGRASREVYGQNKVYLEVAGRPLAVHVVVALQSVPDISEIFIVGNPERLTALFEGEELRAEIHKPLHIVAQRRNLLENCWEGYRRALPGAGPNGREPTEADAHFEVFYISGDLPLTTPQEISTFIRRSQALDCDYALGLVPEEALIPFGPESKGEPGIRVATFNIRNGRLRQSNLHFAKPARLGNRHYIEEMYEHRYQRKFANMASLAWRLLLIERGGPSTVFFFGIIHLAGFVDRIGLRWLSDLLRPLVSLERVERHLSRLLKAEFRFVITDAGGCAIDIDKESEYDAVCGRFDEWRKQQRDRAEQLYGPPALPDSTPRASRRGDAGTSEDGDR